MTEMRRSENVVVESSVLWTAVDSRDLFRPLEDPNGGCSRLRRSSDRTEIKFEDLARGERNTEGARIYCKGKEHRISTSSLKNA
jgi:hypothetical protein